MPTLHNRERGTSDEREDYREQRRSRDQRRGRDDAQDDREISLGTGTILALFFALALLCTIFFGLGYSMGRKTAPPPPIVTAPQPQPQSAASMAFNNSKPSAGSLTSQPSVTAKKNSTESPAQPADPDAEIVTTPVSSSDSEETSATPRTTAHKAATQNAPPAPIVRETPRNAPAPASPPMPAISPNGTAMVQVAAVSHQEDADMLISALKKRGYAVFIRQEPQDHLLHVQIGPFATRKDADAMRQRLLSDGYNSIVK